MSTEARNAAIDWFLDCQWGEGDLDREYFEDLADMEIIQALNKHYAGGYREFIATLAD